MRRVKITEEVLQKAAWVCYDCGIKYGDSLDNIANAELRKLPVWRISKCDVCGKRQTVTEVFNFNHLRKK